MFLLFSVLMMITSSALGFADKDCEQTNCYQNDDYWVKIKRLPNIDLGEWKGTPSVEGSNKLFGKKSFCAISFLEEGKKRTMYDTDLVLTTWSNGKAGQFVVKQGDEEIPLTIKLERFKDDDAPQTPQEFKIGEPVKLKGDDNFDFCKENELTLTVIAYKDDIIRAGATGEYEGDFRMYARSITSPVPLKDVFIEFSIKVKISPVILISGLEDMRLVDEQGPGAGGSQNFCVFSTSTNPFKIRGLSKFGDRVFQLANGDTRIDYDLKVGGRYENNDGKEITLVEGGEFVTTSWTGDNENMDCSGEENMELTVKITEVELKQAEPGVYEDTVTLVVAAQ